ncbi:MAG TPA: folylpolyglutamate synthase/dihydrofolate synthase family protein [Anaerolineales bacterium]|nr:folylpolyglutamate synthase/dihydrofolate synthase family protein [Anaerolineales bacterium]
MARITNYQDALDYIFSFVDFSKTHAANLAPENFDLRRMFALLERLGNPQDSFRSIHIAGTKGKGSTAAFCSSALTAAGHRTGLYTSPHLEDFTERIRVDGEPISEDALTELVEAVKPHVAAVPAISTFEITTALAFMHFARMDADAAVVEVGLGGRLDATNVVTPLVSVITSISYDHTQILGETLGEIAGEKAGIIKPGVPVVSAPQKPEALGAIRKAADAAGARLFVAGEDYMFSPDGHSLDGQDMRVWDEMGHTIRLRIPLLGRHQVENAAVAWAALRKAADAGLPVSGEAVATGFWTVRWPGRFEILRRSPFVVLDAAHNEDSARRLLETLEEYLPERRLTLILGASGDKDVSGFLEILRPRVDWLIATRSEHPRAMPPAEIADFSEKLGISTAVTEDIESAVEFGLAGLPSEAVLLVTGSVFVVGAARAVWQSKTMESVD